MFTIPEKSLFVGNESKNEMNKLLMNEAVGLLDSELIEYIASEFQIEKSVVEAVDILICDMGSDGCYGGDAYLLIRDRATGQLYEVSGSHCSCYGFEGQWEPAITSKEYLLSAQYRYREDGPIMQFVAELCS